MMKTSLISKILIAVVSVAVLVALTAAVTVACVTSSMNKKAKKAAIKEAANLEVPPAMQNINEVGAGDATYTGVGAVHSVTAPDVGVEGEEDGVPVVVTAWFSYPKDDSVFFEELSSKSTLIRKTIAAYFATRTKSELVASGEETVKKELRDAINARLMLGKVGTFYFSEYIFFD